jgi:hypothetical protein
MHGERRSYERRSYAGRRGGEFIHNGFHFNQETGESGHLQDVQNSGSQDLQIDHRKLKVIKVFHEKVINLDFGSNLIPCKACCMGIFSNKVTDKICAKV